MPASVSASISIKLTRVSQRKSQRRNVVILGTLKTRDHEIYEGGKRRTGKRGTKFAGVEKAGQACMECEMTKNRKFSLIDNPVV